MSAMQREKGAKAERAVAELLRPIFPQAVRRASGEESQERAGVDLKNTPGMAIQVTVAEKLNLFAKLAAVPRVPDFLDLPSRPAVFARRNRGRWVVVMYAEDWIDLMKRIDWKDL